MLTLNVSDNAPLPGWGLQHSNVFVVTTNPAYVRPKRGFAALLVKEFVESPPDGFGVVLVSASAHLPATVPANSLRISPKLDYLADGDVIRIAPDGKVLVLYRRAAAFNAFMVTERCNSFCVMCSQPPREIDDAYRVDDLLKAIPLIEGAREICITGGEPTLLGERFFALLRALKAHLPYTSVHILSNGRKFKSLEVASQLASVRHHDLMLGIPLYSDISSIHDFVVQADGAYDETICGILNLKRCGVRIELRVVLHKYTVDRLPQLARFIVRNLQFVDKVALMGLEVTGFAKSNLDDLWVDPFHYADLLREAAEELDRGAVRVAIYNHQLCTLHPSIRSAAVSSISDWKREYIDVCNQCDARCQCGGFFGTSGGKRSAYIRPIVS